MSDDMVTVRQRFGLPKKPALTSLIRT